MRALFDTNVVLDVLLDRHPHSPASSQLVGLVEVGALEGCLGATTMTTLHYLVGKALGRTAADQAVRDLLVIFDIAGVDRAVLDAATGLGLPDYEDAVLHEAGKLAGCDLVVTRDVAGFTGGSLPVSTPLELLAFLKG